EPEAAGLYLPGRGWRDVLHDVGLRVEDPADLDRIRAWQQGAEDPALDRLDLSGRLVRDRDDDDPAGGPGWAADAAAGLVSDLLGRAWAVHADEFLGWIAEAESTGVVRPRAVTMASLGYGVFAGAETPGIEPATEFWTRFERAVDDPAATEDTLLAGPLAEAKPWLASTRVFYWPSRRRGSGSTATARPGRDRSPGVVLRGRPVAREDLVQPVQGGLVQGDVDRAQGAVELLLHPRADDRRGYRGLVQQPGQGELARLVAQLGRQVLVGGELVPVPRHGLGRAALQPPDPLVLLLDHAAEQAAVQRGPGDDADAVVLGGRDHLELDAALDQVVQRLLADQTQVAAPVRRLLRRGEVP